MDRFQQNIINQSALFRLFSSGELGKLLENTGRICTFRKNAAVLKSSECAIILSGTAVIYSGTEQDRGILRFAGCGETIGLAGLWAKDSINTEVRSCGDSDLTALILTSDEIKELMNKDVSGRLRDSLLSLLSRKIGFLNSRIATLNGGSSYSRLAGYILSSAGEDGCFAPDMSMKALADILGIARASLYRACEKLTNEGSVTYENGQFRISDRELLILASGRNTL